LQIVSGLEEENSGHSRLAPMVKTAKSLKSHLESPYYRPELQLDEFMSALQDLFP